MKFQGNVELLSGGQLVAATVENLSSDPVSPYLGQIWYNTTSGSYKGFQTLQASGGQGTAVVVQFATGGALNNYLLLTGGTMTGTLNLPVQNTGNTANYISEVASATQGYVDAKLTTFENTFTGAVTTIISSDLTSSKAVVSDTSGKVAVSTTSAAQVAALGALAAPLSVVVTDSSGIAVTTANTSVTQLNALAALSGEDNFVVVTDASGNLTVSNVTTSQLQALNPGGSGGFTPSTVIVSDTSGNLSTGTATTAEVDALATINTHHNLVLVTSAAGLVTTSSATTTQIDALASLTNTTPFSVVTDGAGNVTTNDTTAAQIETLSALGSNFVVVTNANTPDAGNVVSSGVTTTELNYLSGVTGPIQTQLGTYLPLAGGTMSGSITIPTGQVVSIADAPTVGTSAVNLNTLQNYVAGLTFRLEVQAKDDTATTLPTVLAPIDGYTVVSTDRVLFTNLATGNNEVYVATVTGSAVSWTAAEDLHRTTAAPSLGDTLIVENGTNNENAGYTYNGVQFVQFNGATTLTPGVGISKAGNTISVNLGAGISELPGESGSYTGGIGIDVYATGSLELVDPVSGNPSTAIGSQVRVQLNGSTLNSSVDGLKVAIGGITDVEINSSVLTTGLTGGSGYPIGANIYTYGGITSVSSLGAELGVNGGPGSELALLLADTTLTLSGAGVQVAAGTSAATGGITASQISSNVATIGNGLTGGAGTAISVQPDTNTADSGYDSIISSATGVSVSTTWANGLYLQLTGAAAMSGDLILATSGTPLYEPLSLTNKSAAASIGFVISEVNALTGDSYAIVSALETQITSGYYLYTAGSAGTSFTFNTGLAVKYPAVTVTDGAGNYIIPQSISFSGTGSSDYSVTVTFNSAITPIISAMGVAPYTGPSLVAPSF